MTQKDPQNPRTAGQAKLPPEAQKRDEGLLNVQPVPDPMKERKRMENSSSSDSPPHKPSGRADTETPANPEPRQERTRAFDPKDGKSPIQAEESPTQQKPKK